LLASALFLDHLSDMLQAKTFERKAGLGYTTTKRETTLERDKMAEKWSHTRIQVEYDGNRKLRWVCDFDVIQYSDLIG